MSRFLLALLLALPLAPVAAQQTSVSAFQNLLVSPIGVGVGGATAFAPTESPYAVRFNPALLADAGARPGLRFSAGLAPDAFGDQDQLIGSSALSIGMGTSVAGYPLHVGLGGGYSELNVDGVQQNGPLGIPLDPYDTEQRSYGGGLGIGWDGPIHVRIGGSSFYRESRETPRLISDRSALGRDRVTTLDLGTAITYDVLGGPDEAGEAAISLRITGGYARRNIVLQEDYFTRDDTFPSAPAPPPEAGVFGGSAAVAFTQQFGRRFRFRVARADVRAEMEKADQQDATRIGASLTLFETLVLRAGQMQRDMQEDVTSAGIGVQLDGLVRAIGAATNNPRLLSFGDRLTLRGDVARYDLGEAGETDYAGFTLGWR